VIRTPEVFVRDVQAKVTALVSTGAVTNRLWTSSLVSYATPDSHHSRPFLVAPLR
jgi:hypothetical protein